MEKINNTFMNVACPICSNRDFKVILRFTPDQFLNKERKKYYNLKALGIGIKTNFYIKKCKNCGFVFVNPRLKKDLYSIVYNEAKSGQYANKKWAYNGGDLESLYNMHHKFREIFPFLSALLYFKEYFKKPKNEGYKQLRLLDYGCGNGHILDLCKIFGINGTGVEIDAVRLNNCKKKGLNVMLPSELAEDKKFNIIISTSVIEHVDNLNDYFKYVSDRLMKNGIFAFNGLTPRIINIEKKESNFKIVMPLEHINYFTKKTLLMLAKKYGFEEAKGSYGVFAVDNLRHCFYPLLKKNVFKGFYPSGNFEITLIKKS